MDTFSQDQSDVLRPSVSTMGKEAGSEVVVIEDRSVSEYFRILSKYRRLILACFMLFASVALALCLLLPNQYVSTALVAIEPYLTPLPDTSQQGMLYQYSNTEWYAKNRMNYLSSHTLADRVLSLPGIGDELKKALHSMGDDNRLAESQALGYKNSLPLIERYLSRVENLRLPTTTTTKLWASLPGALLSAKAVNAHAEEFIKLVEEEEARDSKARVEYLEKRSKEIEGRMAEAESKINDYLRQHPLSMGIFSEFSDFARISAFDIELRRLGELIASATDKKSLSSSEKEDSSEAKFRKIIEDDSALSDMRQRLTENEATRASLLKQYRPEHPKVQAVIGTIESLKHDIARTRETLIQKAQEEVDARVRIDGAQVDRLTTAIDSAQKRAADQIVDKFQLQSRQREFLRVHELFEIITKNLEEARMTYQTRLTNITILSAAIPAREPTSPNRPVIIVIACFLGPLLGCVLAFILNMLDNSIYSIEDMVAATGVSSVGMIPSLGYFTGDEGHHAVAEIIESPAVTDTESAIRSRDPGSGRGSTASPQPLTDSSTKRTPSRRQTAKHVTERSGSASFEREIRSGTARFHQTQRFTGLFKPMRATTRRERAATELLTIVEPFSDFTEAFRNIRTSVMLEASGREAKSLLVTSSLKGEGKSTVAGNLAVSMAQFGHRVLLVDADLRRPTLHEFFGMTRDSAGLGNYLQGEKGSYDVVYRTSVPGLDFVCAGPPTPNPAELLGTKLMKGFLELMIENYDFVIIDAPPVLPVADARILGLAVNSVLFVTRSGYTERQVARNGVRRLQQLGIKVAGAILNDVDITDALFYHESGDEMYGPDEEQMPWFAQIRTSVDEGGEVKRD